MSDQKTLNTLMKGAGWTAVGMVLSKFLTYFYRAAVARFEGPGAYGQLSLGITVLSLTGTVALLAMNQAIKKYVPEHRSRDEDKSARGVVLSAMQLSLPLAIIGGVILYLSAGFIASEIFNSQGLAEIIQILALVPPFAMLSRISISTLVAHKEIKYRVITNHLFQNITQLAITVPLLVFGFGTAGAAWGWFGGAALSALLAFYFMETKVGPFVFTSKDSKINRRKVINYSYPLLFSGIIGTVLGWADTMFLGYFMDDTAVGLYNAALPTALLILLPYKAFKSLALPSLSEKIGRDEDIDGILKTLTRWTFYLSFPAFLLMALFSEQVLHLLFGSEFRTASVALVILGAGHLFSASVGHLDEVIKSISETKILLKNSVANLGLNVVLNIVLIPTYGIVGAAIATASSTIFVNTLLILEVYYLRRIQPFSSDTWKPVLSAAPSLLITYLVFDSLFNYTPLWALVPAGIMFMAIYLVTLVLVRGVKEEDREIIVGAGRKIGKEREAEKLADLLTR